MPAGSQPTSNANGGTRSRFTFSVQIPFILLGTCSVPQQIWSHGEKHTRPLYFVCELLQYCCEGLQIEAWPPASSLNQSKCDEDLRQDWEIIRDGWIVRYGDEQRDAEQDDAMMEDGPFVRYPESRWIGKHEQNDGTLSDADKTMLGPNAWSLSMALQRFNMEMARKEDFFVELTHICEILGDGLSAKNGMAILCPGSCRFKLGIEDSGLERWETDMTRKIFLLLTGWERELLVTESMRGVLDHASMSRFLTWRGMKALEREKVEAWAVLDGKKGRQGQKERLRQKWLRDLAHVDVLQRIDGPWIWENLTEINANQEEELNKFIRDMLNYEERGGKLAVCLMLDQQQGQGAGISDNLSLAIRSIVFQSHRSCVDGPELCAYVDFITELSTYVQSVSYEALTREIQSFRTRVEIIDEAPRDSLVRLLKMLGVQRSTSKWYANDSPPSASIQRPKENPNLPFYKLQRHIGIERRKELQYMPTLIKRYEEAGGFHAPSRAKLNSLLLAKEAEQNHT